MFFKLPAGHNNSGIKGIEEITGNMCAPYIELGLNQLHEFYQFD
ncbi:hypothetical protein PPAR_b0197 [Pseudoalteromonas paragorgicola KMM 3548]|nr:hypothetical protein [Pseudoalteromonas distincta KMM 3548]